MNWDQIEGNWRQFKGKVIEKWGRLTEDDVDVIQGRREQLVGKVQERYGVVREEAERQVAEFLVAIEDAMAGRGATPRR